MGYKEPVSITQLASDTSHLLRGDSGKTYQVVAGVIRPVGDGSWELIDDANHNPLNIASVVADASKIRVTYGTPATAMVSMVVTPDEQFSVRGYSAGASAGLTYSDISLSNPARTIGCYLSYNGATWDVAGPTGNMAFSSSNSGTGRVTLSHDSISGVVGSATGRESGNRPVFGSIGATTTDVYFTDAADAVITTGFTTSMKAFISRSKEATTADPTDVTLAYANSNLWIYGIMEI